MLSGGGNCGVSKMRVSHTIWKESWSSCSGCVCVSVHTDLGQVCKLMKVRSQNASLVSFSSLRGRLCSVYMKALYFLRPNDEGSNICDASTPALTFPWLCPDSPPLLPPTVNECLHMAPSQGLSCRISELKGISKITWANSFLLER